MRQLHLVVARAQLDSKVCASTPVLFCGSCWMLYVQDICSSQTLLRAQNDCNRGAVVVGKETCSKKTSRISCFASMCQGRQSGCQGRKGFSQLQDLQKLH
ncbi:hypothetical protein ISCGN_020970 [Ixodes scapularis]